MDVIVKHTKRDLGCLSGGGLNLQLLPPLSKCYIKQVKYRVGQKDEQFSKKYFKKTIHLFDFFLFNLY